MNCQHHLITGCVVFMCLELAQTWASSDLGCRNAQVDWLFVGLLAAVIRFTLLLLGPTNPRKRESLFRLAIGRHFEIVILLCWAARGAYLLYKGCLGTETQNSTSHCLALS